MNDRLAFLQAEALQHAAHALRAEDAHQVVFEGQEEVRAAGIALATGTAAQLVVDAPALVPLGADHEQAAGILDHLVPVGDLVAQRGLARRLFNRILDVAELLAYAHLDIAAELDVGAAAGHVRCDRDRVRLRRPAR